MTLWHNSVYKLDVASLTNEHALSVCMGSEWYTFPSHFFMPHGVTLNYYEDGFTGILPQHFAAANGTFCEPLQPFNGENKEERSRYVSLESCDFIVRLESPEKSNSSNQAWIQANTVPVASTEIIDSSRSPVLSRVLWLPGLKVMSNNVFKKYTLYKRQQKSHGV
jgi:alpha-1,2-mannosyltransferase